MRQALLAYKVTLNQFPNHTMAAKEQTLVDKELELLVAYQESCPCTVCCCKDKCTCAITPSCRGYYAEKQMVSAVAERLDPFRIKPQGGSVNAGLEYTQSWYCDTMIIGSILGFLLSASLCFVIVNIE